MERRGGFHEERGGFHEGRGGFHEGRGGTEPAPYKANGEGRDVSPGLVD